MKWEMDPKIHSHDKMYGVVTVGARGQVVIPIDARKDFKINPGDQLVVLGKFNKVLGFIRADQLGALIDMIVEHIPEGKEELKAHVREHIEGVFSKAKKPSIKKTA